MLTLITTENTYFKQAPREAIALPPDAKILVERGAEFALLNHEPIIDLNAKADNDSHIKFNLLTPHHGKQAWWVYQRHAVIMQGDKLLFPAPEVDEDTSDRALTAVPGKYLGKRFKLPSGMIVFTDQPILSAGHFSWGQATHGGVRVPQTSTHEANIINLAKELERVRRSLGPLRITSWYRPEPWNSKAGGASRSQHLTGAAVDFMCKNLTGREMAARVSPFWRGGMGIYPGDRKWILHLDIGPKRSWGI